MHLHQFFDGEAEFLQFEGLEQIVVSAQLHGLHGVLDIAVRRHHEDVRLDLAFLEFLKQGQAVHLRHFDVDEHDVIPIFPDLGQGRDPVCGGFHLVAVLFQPAAQRFADAQFVIHHQDPDLVMRQHFLLPV